MDAGLDPSRDTGFWDQLLFNNAFEPSENGPEPLLSSTVHSSNNFGSSGRHPFYPTVPTPPSHESSYSRQQSRMFPSLNTTHHATHSSAPNTSTQPLASFDLPDFPLPQNNIQPPPSQDLAFGPEYQGSDFQLPNLDTLVQELEPTDRSDPWSSSIDRLFEDSWTDPHTSGDFIDLTTDSSPPTMPVITRKRKPSEQTSSESSSILLNTAKRKRTGNLHLKNENTAVEEVDLREVDDDQGLSKILHDQQAATIKAQQQQESETPLTLSTVQCVVCMDSMTDMTVTHCGKCIKLASQCKAI